MERNRKSTVKKSLFAVIILVLLIALIGGTYARYTTSGTGSANVSVAKWVVNIKNGDSPISENQNVAFVLQANENVKEGKIAPSSKATATVSVDMTGTEVASILTATIDSSSLATVFGDAADRVNLKMTVDGTEYNSGDSAEIALADVSKVHNVVLTLEWTENNVDAENVEDTTVGISGKDITLPVTITATQKV